ncbi:hypothetical protein PIROE2DRAFT_42978, partial [Piromyces sp. E2]
NILKYLNSIKDFKINYDGNGTLNPHSDVGFAGDIKDRKSTSGCIIFYGKSPIACYSKN